MKKCGYVCSNPRILTVLEKVSGILDHVQTECIMRDRMQTGPWMNRIDFEVEKWFG